MPRSSLNKPILQEKNTRQNECAEVSKSIFLSLTIFYFSKEKGSNTRCKPM